MVQRKFFDGIIMDKEMPIMGGCEATKRIRELGFTGFIISVTGDSATDAAVMLENGADVTLQKPVNVKELVHLIVHRFACLPDFVPRSSPPAAAKEHAGGR
jgi:CheY-like chemotaxis protein